MFDMTMVISLRRKKEPSKVPMHFLYTIRTRYGFLEKKFHIWQNYGICNLSL